MIFSCFRNSDGNYSIKVRIIYQSRSTNISTHFVATPQQLTRSLAIKDRALQMNVDNFIQTLRNKVNELSVQELNKMNVKDVAKYLLSPDKGTDFKLDFFEYGRKIADEHARTSGDNYRNALKALAAFMGLDWMKDTLDISEIKSSVMRNFERYLINKHGENSRCISLYTSHIRTIHKRAQGEFNDEEMDSIRIRNPFLYYTPPSQPAARHRDLDKSIIQQLINDCPYLKGAEQVAVETYLLAFALMGMNFPDLYLCAPPVDGVLRYERHKVAARTKVPVETYVRIPEGIRPIADKWADKTGQYAFSFFQRYVDYRSMQINIGRGLKLYANSHDIKSQNKLTFYSGRHSWATLMSDAHMPISIINDGLSHVDPNYAMTQIYIRKNWNNVWEANETFLSENFDWSPLLKINND